MLRFSTTYEHSFIETNRETINLAVKTNGGSVSISVWDGSEYVVSDTISADGGYQIVVRGLKIKFTPSGGATFSLALGA